MYLEVRQLISLAFTRFSEITFAAFSQLTSDIKRKHLVCEPHTALFQCISSERIAWPFLCYKYNNWRTWQASENLKLLFLLPCPLTKKGTIACLGTLLLHRLTAEYLRCKCFISTGYPSGGHHTNQWHLKWSLWRQVAAPQLLPAPLLYCKYHFLIRN